MDRAASIQAIVLAAVAEGPPQEVGYGEENRGRYVHTLQWVLARAGAGGGRLLDVGIYPGHLATALRQALGGLRVGDVMTTEVKTVPADATVRDLIEDYFIRYTYGGYPVVKDGRVVGLVTLHELRNTAVEGRTTTRVERVMVPLDPRLVVDPRTAVIDALNRMAAGGAGRLVVLERDQMVGLITANGIVHLTQIRSSLGG